MPGSRFKETRDAEPPAAAKNALAKVGFTWERLEKLAWKALNDRMRRHGISLDEDRLQRAFEWYTNVGVDWARDYDSAKSRGVGFPSSCYRRMYPRLTDFLRQEHGDSRRGTPLTQVPTAVMPETFDVDPVTLQEIAREVELRLPSPWLRKVFRQLPLRMALFGITLAEAAEKSGISLLQAEELMGDLQAVLFEQGWHEPESAATGETADLFTTMTAWSADQSHGHEEAA